MVWEDQMAREVRLERPRFTSCRVGESGGWLGNNQKDRRECVLAMGNAVAPVVHLVVTHHKDSQCAAVMHRSGAECARDGEKLKGTRRCCLLHLDGAPSASDDAGEADAHAGVRAPVGVVVE